MTVKATLRVTFHGVRGSSPSPEAEVLGFGGNTACVEVASSSGARLVIDAGTGLRQLGKRLAREPHGQEVALFLSHYHWDHLQGLPSFEPLYERSSRICIVTGDAPSRARKAVGGLLSAPYHPVSLPEVPARIRFLQADRQGVVHAGMRLRTLALHHPGGCHGLVVECGGLKLVYASDHEPGRSQSDQELAAAAEGADLLILDAQFLPAEFARKRGWGHGTWREATRMARQARARRLVLFHHAPQRTDVEVGEIVQAARRVFPATDAAREGWSVLLNGDDPLQVVSKRDTVAD